MNHSQQQSQRDPAATHSFSSFLSVVQDGQLHADLTRELQDLIGDLQNAYLNQGGTPKGELTIKFGFKLEDGVTEVTGNFSVTGPKPVRGKTIFWVTPDNILTQRNPKQSDMFRDVNRGGEMRTV